LQNRYLLCHPDRRQYGGVERRDECVNFLAVADHHCHTSLIKTKTRV